jgi:ATP-dependent RNA helicase DeaD
VAARGDGEEQEIPAVTPRAERPGSERFERPSRFDRGGAREESRGSESRGGESRGGDARGPRGEGKPEKGGKRARKEAAWTAAKLWIGAGRKLKMRPGDLVGAIANEAGLDSSHIGAIQIADNFSTVEVPEALAEEVIDALKRTKIKGLKVQVRRDRMGR